MYQNGESMYTRNLLTQVLEKGTQALTPFVGMPVTVNHYTGRQAATIVDVSKSGKRIVVENNKVECLCYYMGRYEVLPETEGGPYAFTLRKNGRWARAGDTQNGPGISLGIHSHYVNGPGIAGKS
jgi:hypothetical protein